MAWIFSRCPAIQGPGRCAIHTREDSSLGGAREENSRTGREFGTDTDLSQKPATENRLAFLVSTAGIILCRRSRKPRYRKTSRNQTRKKMTGNTGNRRNSAGLNGRSEKQNASRRPTKPQGLRTTPRQRERRSPCDRPECGSLSNARAVAGDMTENKSSERRK